MRVNTISLVLLCLILSSCKVGPDYKKPTINVPCSFRAAGMDWHGARSSDDNNGADWWKRFKNPTLNALEAKLHANNYSIKAAEASYREALALVDKARIGYLPTITGSSALLKQKQAPTGSNATSRVTSSHAWMLDASWETDLWGNLSRTVESSRASSDITKATLASIKLSSEASLAQYYFELRMLEKDQELYDKIVDEYQAILTYAQNRYLSGIDGEQAVTQASGQLQTAKAQAVNNKIDIAQYQHAIAVLIGEQPSSFTITKDPEMKYPNISIPITVPGVVLERRPDIAAAERQVAVANAGIGVASSAFFPNLTISGSAARQGTGLKKLLTVPILIWSVGPELALNLTNLTAYKAATNAAKENYNASVATYTHTVLAAFQDVEDNMVALRILTEQVKILEIGAESAKRNMDIIANQYASGIVDQSQISLAKIAYYNAMKSLNDTEGLKITAAIGLIKALGGDLTTIKTQSEARNLVLRRHGR